MYAYNPFRKKHDLLKRSLVGRSALYNEILADFDLAQGERPRQHWMLVGPRGIGKSHILTLLYHDIREKHGAKWLPILFPEDLPGIGNLLKFLQKTMDEIRERLDPVGDKQLISKISNRESEIKKLKDTNDRISGYFSLLKLIHEETGKYILLIVENLQQLIGRKFKEIEQKQLRAFLQESDAATLLGSATTVFNEIIDNAKPFFQFFNIQRLDELKFDDMKKLILDAVRENNPDLKLKPETPEAQMLETQLKTVYAFTGGNPRIGTFLADILSGNIDEKAVLLLDGLIDGLTPYFESIFNDSPESQRAIIIALAEKGPAMSPMEIAEHLGEDSSENIRNNIKLLKENRHIRVAFSKGKHLYYCVSDYFYRIWYQMRHSGIHGDIRGLAELCLMLYSLTGVEERLKNICELDNPEDENNYFIKTVYTAAIDLNTKEPKFCERIEMYRNNVFEENWDNENAEECQQLLEKARIHFDSKEYDKAIECAREYLETNPDSDYCYVLIGLFLEKKGMHEEAIESYLKATEINPKYEYAFVCWGNLLWEMGSQLPAIVKFESAIQVNPKYEYAYYCWGNGLRKMGLYEQAIEKFQLAIDINPKYEYAYHCWGNCLHKLGRYGISALMFTRYFYLCTTMPLQYLLDVHNLFVIPQLKNLSPENYLKAFYSNETIDDLLTVEIVSLLVLLRKFDVVEDYLNGLITTSGKDKVDVEILLMTLRNRIVLSVEEDNLSDVRRLTNMLIKCGNYRVDSDEDKGKTTLELAYYLFSIQGADQKYQAMIEAILDEMKNAGDEVPYSGLIEKIWICISDPESLEAQRNMTDRAIAEVVKEIRKRSK